MASRLGQHLFRAKSKTENFGLFSLYLCYFLYLLCGCAMANFSLLSRKQSPSPNVNHCIWAICFGPKVTKRGWVSTPNWFRSGIWWQLHNPRIPNCRKHSPQTCSKMRKCPQYPKQLLLGHSVNRLLIYRWGGRGLEYLKKSYIRIFCENGEGDSIEGREGGRKHCFSLIR